MVLPFLLHTLSSTSSQMRSLLHASVTSRQTLVFIDQVNIFSSVPFWQLKYLGVCAFYMYMCAYSSIVSTIPVWNCKFPTPYFHIWVDYTVQNLENTYGNHCRVTKCVSVFGHFSIVGNDGGIKTTWIEHCINIFSPFVKVGWVIGVNVILSSAYAAASDIRFGGPFSDISVYILGWPNKALLIKLAYIMMQALIVSCWNIENPACIETIYLFVFTTNDKLTELITFYYDEIRYILFALFITKTHYNVHKQCCHWWLWVHKVLNETVYSIRYANCRVSLMLIK